jgi:hypothetical protein
MMMMLNHWGCVARSDVFGHAILVKESQNVETYVNNPKSPSMAAAATQSTGTQPRFTIVARWGFPPAEAPARSMDIRQSQSV